MKKVEPIRDPKKIKTMRLFLRQQSLRNELLFVLGINTGLRISDILQCQVRDVCLSNRKIREYVVTKEIKTGKTKKYYLSPVVRKLLEEYLKGFEPVDEDAFLFCNKRNPQRPISRIQAWRIINDAAEFAGLVERDREGKLLAGEIGTHTLRKTFGYHAYQAGYSIELLMDIFNHSSQAQTLRYIGIREEDRKEVYMNLNLGE